MAGITLAADIGTSSLKAAFIDFNGNEIAFCRSAYNDDLSEINATAAPKALAWEKAFACALNNLCLKAPSVKIDGICISGNGPTLAPLTFEGEALPPLYWFDGKTFIPEHSDVKNGDWQPLSFFLPRAAWLKKNSPEDYKRTLFFLSPHEWLSFKLGAGAHCILPSPAYEPYYWDDDQLRFFELEREKFPPFARTGEIIGRVSAEAASLFGRSSANCIKSGTPIVAGGPDFLSALIGTGTMKAGDVCDRAGSSEGINVCASVLLGKVYGKGLRVLPHAKEGLWNIGAVIASSGRMFENFRLSAGQENRTYDDLLAELISPSRLLFHGFPLPASHSAFSAPRSPIELGRFVLCAMGFAVRSALVNLASSGYPVKEMTVSGGQGKNALWNQLKADITGVNLLVPEICDGELMGNAILAAAALGKTSIEDASLRMIRIKEIYKPENGLFWEERYKEFLKDQRITNN